MEVERAACISCVAHNCEGQLLGNSSRLREAACTLLLTAVSDFLQNGSKVSFVNCPLVSTLIPRVPMNGVIPTTYLPSLHFPLLYFVLPLESLEEQQASAFYLAAVVRKPELRQNLG